MSPEPHDLYYRRLQVGQNASHEEIVQAYRRLAQGTHPDARPEDADAPERFRAITEAYEVLADPQRRAAYDSHQRAARASARTVPVTARPASGSSAPLRRFGPSHIGASRTDYVAPPGSTGGAPLWAGPVRIESERERRPREDWLVGDAEVPDFWYVVAAMLDAWRRR